MAKVLLIDDDTVLLKLYSTRLKAGGHEVATAVNGEEGLRRLAQFRPDIVILDLLMPKINGFAFIETIRKHPTYTRTRIIVFSSVANQEQITRLKTLGITTYLNKIDTSPTQLVNIIHQELGIRPDLTPASI
jgi:CheY-like chemotaxis protein